MNRIIRASVSNWGVVVGFIVIGAIAGWLSYKSLPIDAVPDITNVQVQVNTAVEGLIPEEIERFVTYPVESSMGGLPDVKEVRSITRFGLSQVTIVFEEGADIYRARQLVSERLQSIGEDLPSGVQPELGPISTGLGEIFFYTLDAKKPAKGAKRAEQLMELRALQEWSIKPRLLTVPGVAEINTAGGYEKKFFVQPVMKRLSRYGVHVGEIVRAIRENNRNTGGGYVQQTSEQLLVQATGIIRSVSDIKNVPVKRLENLRTVTVGDLAEVKLDREIRTGAALYNGKETIVGTILMLLGENSRQVSIDVGKRIEEISGSLPDWVKLEVAYDRSDLVNATLGTVVENLVVGAILVAIILMLLVGNLRVAAITALTIPLAMIMTVILMRAFGVSGNLMSLGALDFGIIIDGAVIVMDNCVRWIADKNKELGRKLTRAEVKEAVINATIEIRKAAGFGQIIIVIVFLPIFALSGVEGKMFVPMATTFCFALLGGFVIAFSVVPAIAGRFLPGSISTKEPRLMSWFQRRYRPLLEKVLRRKRLTLSAGVGLIGAGIILFLLMGANFLPQLDEGSIAVQFVRPTNISIDQSVEMQKVSENLILEFPQVDRVLSRIGTSEIATDPMGVNISDTYVLLKNKDEWTGNVKDKNELIEQIKSKLEARIPGQKMIFSQPIQLRFNELLEGVRADVAVKVFGDDLDELSRISQEVASVIKSVDGAGDAESEMQGKSPVLRISPKTDILNNLGIAKEEVLGTVETSIGGKEAGSLYEGIMRFPIIVRLSESDRSEIDMIKQIPVGAAENLTIPMSSIADVGIHDTFGELKREESRKRVAILVNVRGRDMASFVEEAKSKISEKVKLPPGYYITWGGSFKNLESAKEHLTILVPLALIAVILMIYTAFGSAIETALIFASVPMALVGGVLGLLLNGLDFSISAAVGFIALSGIAVLNGVVLVSYFGQLKAQGVSSDQLVLEGTRIRLRPVLMTALTDAFGFLPMMLSTGMGAEVQRPLASVVVGGILTATLLTLVVLPAAYRILDDKGLIKARENASDLH